MNPDALTDLFRRSDAETAQRIRLLGAILDHLPLGIYVKDAATLRFVYRNRAFSDMIGYAREEIIGRTVHELYPAGIAEAFEAADRQALAAGRVDIPEQTVVLKDGSARHMRSRKVAIADAEGRPWLIVGIAEDMSAQQEAERHRLEGQATQRQAKLERMARINQLGEMAAGLAHEINQPLAALTYTLTGAIHRARDGNLNPAQTLEALQAAIAHAHRAAGIVSRVRDLAGRHERTQAPLQLNAVVSEMAELARSMTSRVGATLLTELEPRLPLVTADKVQIEQVLLNLIGNGLDAAVEAGGRDRRVLVQTARLDDGAIEVGVEDSGAGMPPERLTRIFEPFYTTKEGGMGLGLSICQTIVEEHGGRIRAENRPEGGARVSFTLPVRSAG